jgi:hypothetical protein
MLYLFSQWKILSETGKDLVCHLELHDAAVGAIALDDHPRIRMWNW